MVVHYSGNYQNIRRRCLADKNNMALRNMNRREDIIGRI
jgi:hypothetical protein